MRRTVHRGRSAVTNAGAHTCRLVIVRLDLEDFFASITARRVYGIFRTAGYPESVAYTLTALCSNVVPPAVAQAVAWPGTGADRASIPSATAARDSPPAPGRADTPALANLAAFGLDRRLTGLARALGATYTRYADDITLSGDNRLLRTANPLRQTIAQIARDEGFAVNDRKSTLATRAGRQQVCGVVVNQRTNLARRDYDTLKATIHNAARHGPAGQNRTGVPICEPT